MDTQNNEVKKLLENEAFLEGLVDAETPEELAEVLKANNLELEEGLTIEKAFEVCQASKTDELSEEALEDVAGGVVITLGIAATWMVSSALLGFFTSYGYHTVKDAVKSKKKK